MLPNCHHCVEGYVGDSELPCFYSAVKEQKQMSFPSRFDHVLDQSGPGFTLKMIIMDRTVTFYFSYLVKSAERRRNYLYP